MPNRDELVKQAEEQAVRDYLTAQGTIDVPPEPVSQEPGLLGKFVKPAVLPTGLGYAGAAFGGGLGTPFGMTVPGGIAGAAIGSAAGEAANQALGITPPSLGQIGMAGALPAAVGSAGALIRPLIKMVPTSRAAQTLNALAPEEAAARLAPLQPKRASKLLFAEATAQRVKIPVAKAIDAVDDMLDDLTQGSKGVQRVNNQAINYLKGLKAKFEANQLGLSPLELQRELEGAGQIIKSIHVKGGSGSGAVKKVFGALVDDLDDAAKGANPAMPAAKTLIAARNTFKREGVIREMADAIEGATKILRGQKDQVQFNADHVIKEIGQNRFYKEAFNATERQEIEGLFKMLNKIPALRPGAGAQFGSGRVAEMVRMGSIGGGTGAMAGGGEGAAIGAAVGTAVPPVIEFGKNLATAMQMQTGRALLKQLLTESKGVATPQIMSIIAAYATAVNAGVGQ